MCTRRNKILNPMTSFGKESYTKAEMLPEMVKLKEQIVNATFNEEHAQNGDLDLKDVEKHFKDLNEARGNIASRDLVRFIEQNKKLIWYINAEISGAKGERKAFHDLDRLNIKSKVLKNVELKDDQHRTEVDAIVITPYGISIVEVKNSTKDIYIDDAGNFYRVSGGLRLDCNLAKKMNLREQLIRQALKKSKLENIAVNKIVVFTNDKIIVDNECKEFKTCFDRNLNDNIRDFKGETLLSEEAMEIIEDTINSARVVERYPFEFDVQEYKETFADLVIKLEESKDETEEVPENKNAEPVQNKVLSFSERIDVFLKSRSGRYAKTAAATVLIATGTALVANGLLNTHS